MVSVHEGSPRASRHPNTTGVDGGHIPPWEALREGRLLLSLSPKGSRSFSPHGVPGSGQKGLSDHVSIDSHFGDGETEKGCPQFGAPAGLNPLMGLEWQSCPAWVSRSPTKPLSLWGLLNLSHLSASLRGRESHPRDPSWRRPVCKLGREHHRHPGQQAHLWPARGDPHPPQRYCAPSGAPGAAGGREEVLIPGHTDSCHPRRPVARERVGYLAEERRPTTCFM